MSYITQKCGLCKKTIKRTEYEGDTSITSYDNICRECTEIPAVVKFQDTEIDINKVRPIPVNIENFIQVIQPDYYIKIGVKDGKYNNIDWQECLKVSHKILSTYEVLDILEETVEHMKKQDIILKDEI